MAKNIEMQVLNGSSYEAIYPVPAGHKASHISGDDKITPADIGAYTKTETDALLENKANSNHTHTPASIGASATGHTHDDRYYTESEVNSLISGKQDTSTAINTGNIGSQSVNYANSAGNADTLDNVHVSYTYNEYAIKLIGANTNVLVAGDSGLTSGCIYLQFE